MSGFTGTNTLTFTGALTQTGGFTVADASNVTIAATGSYDVAAVGIFLNGGTFTNQGIVRAIPMGDTNAVQTSTTVSTTVVNAVNARIEGSASGVIQLQGGVDGALTVSNAGLIRGIRFDGVTQHGTGALRVTNDGTGVIYGQNTSNSVNGYGVGSDGSGALTLTNAIGGKIVGRYGAVGSNAADTITNSGTIASGSYNTTNGTVTAGGIAGIQLRAGGTVTNRDGGVIDSGGRGVSLGAAGTVDNQLGGIIRHTGTADNGTGNGAGVYASGNLTLTNGGTINTAAGGGNDGVTVLGVATITNTGTIQAANAAGIAIAGAGSSISNSGTIQGGTSGLGVNLNNGGTIKNQTGGLIAGSQGGIISSGSGAATITNDGAINASVGGQGIVLQAGGTITNGGTRNTTAMITATNGSGIDNTGDAATVVNNYGRIQGTNNSGAGQASGAGAFTLNNLGTASIVYGTGNLGVYNVGSGALTVNNAGLIVSGGSAAIRADGAANITNGGKIGIGSIDANGAYVASTTSSSQAILLNAGGTVTNQSGGLIQGGDRGILSNAALTLTNLGTISGANNGVGLSGGASSILNAGTISSSTNYGVAAGGVGATLSVTNATGGRITGGTSTTESYGLGSNGQAMTVSNYGSIGGGAGGIFVLNNLTLTANLYAGSVTGSIRGSGGNDTVSLYTGTGTNGTGATTTDPVTGQTVVLQAAGTNRAATVGAIDLGGGTNTLNLQGTGDGTTGNGDIGVIAGVIAGTTAVNKQNAGTFVLSGANTYSGLTTVSAGILSIQSNTALGATGTGNGTSIASGATLQVQGSIIVGAEALSLGGNGVGGNGALENVNDANTYGGTVTLTAAARIQSDAGNLTLNAANAVTGNFNLTVGGEGNTAIVGTITTGTGTLTKDGAGVLTLSAVNTHTGTTAITAGTLALSGAGSIALSSGVIDNANFDISGVTATTSSIVSLAGTMAGATVTLGTKTLNLTAAADTFAGRITGTGGVTVAGGTEILTGTSDYTGATTIVAGATLQFGAGGSSGQINAASAILNDGTLAFNHSDVLTFSNAISGAGSLTQAGTNTSTLILTGTDSYAGATTVSGGTLFVNNALAGGGAVTVAAGAVLGGTGTIAGTVTVSGTISGGQGVGALTTGSLALQTGATFHQDVATSTVADRINVTGTVSLAGLLDFSTPTDFAAGIGQNLILIANDATDAVTGRFTSLKINTADVGLSGDGFSLQGHNYLIDYRGGDGNDVAIRDITPGPTQPTPTPTPTPAPTQPAGPTPQPNNAPFFGDTVTDTSSPIGASAGPVYGLYKAVLGRTPDVLGLENFTTAIQNGATLSDVANALLGSPEGASVPNAAADPNGFVQSLYQKLLGRAVDASGLQTFTGELAAGVSPATVVVQLATSAEAQSVLASTFQGGVYVPDASETGVARLYYGLLGRAPDAGGLRAFTNFVENGGGGAAGEAGRLDQAAATILSSTEYAGRNPSGTDLAFVNGLYQGALGRSPEAGGAEFYINQLTQGVSRATVTLEISQSAEAQIHLVGVIENGFQLAG